MVDIATRVYNHDWKIDPIVRSVLDTDFYKLLMAQTIFRRHRHDQVTFGIINRTTTVRLGEILDSGMLREQLDHVRTLSLSRGESTWLRGNMFYGKRQMFSPDFIAWLENFRFPAYHLDRREGQYELTFEGPWIETTMWEIPALAIINELRTRVALRGTGKFELQVLYARAMTRVWEKIERLKTARGPQHRRFRNAPAPQLPVAGLVRSGDDGRAWPLVPRNIELHYRASPRGGGGWHQRARTADGLLRARRQR